MVKKKADSPRQDHNHKIFSIFNIYSSIYSSSNPPPPTPHPLPRPPEQFVKQLGKLFYKSLWNSGPDRISRNVIIQDVKEDGQRMIKINKFIESLKVTWLRRILISTNERSWNRLSHVDFGKLVIFGDGHAKLCASNLSNPFWIDVLNSWKAFLKCNPASQTEDVLNSPIWFNSDMQHGKKVFIKNWYEKGIRNIVYLVN